MTADLARKAALAMRRELMMNGVVGGMQWRAGGCGDQVAISEVLRLAFG